MSQETSVLAPYPVPISLPSPYHAHGGTDTTFLLHFFPAFADFPKREYDLGCPSSHSFLLFFRGLSLSMKLKRGLIPPWPSPSEEEYDPTSFLCSVLPIPGLRRGVAVLVTSLVSYLTTGRNRIYGAPFLLLFSFDELIRLFERFNLLPSFSRTTFLSFDLEDVGNEWDTLPLPLPVRSSATGQRLS